LETRAAPRYGDHSLHCSDTDPVWARMTRASALVTVAPETFYVEAEELARNKDVRHLVVVADGRVTGILCRCDLVPSADPNARIGVRMSLDVFAISTTATLGEALAAMVTLHLGCLPVLAGDLLVGIITRGDLHR